MQSTYGEASALLLDIESDQVVPDRDEAQRRDSASRFRRYTGFTGALLLLGAVTLFASSRVMAGPSAAAPGVASPKFKFLVKGVSDKDEAVVDPCLDNDPDTPCITDCDNATDVPCNTTTPCPDAAPCSEETSPDSTPDESASAGSESDDVDESNDDSDTPCDPGCNETNTTTPCPDAAPCSEETTTQPDSTPDEAVSPGTDETNDLVDDDDSDTPCDPGCNETNTTTPCPDAAPCSEETTTQPDSTPDEAVSVGDESNDLVDPCLDNDPNTPCITDDDGCNETNTTTPCPDAAPCSDDDSDSSTTPSSDSDDAVSGAAGDSNDVEAVDPCLDDDPNTPCITDDDDGCGNATNTSTPCPDSPCDDDTTPCPVPSSNCLTTDGVSCTGCSDGFYLHYGACNACKAGCAECSAEDVCSSCSAGYFFYDSRCVATCPKFWYGAKDTRECVVCSADCEACSGSTTCDKCKSGFSLVTEADGDSFCAAATS